MQIRWTENGREYRVDTRKFYDLSIPVDTTGPLAWYLDHPRLEAVRDTNWIGSVAEGGSVNFRNISFNPHSHCTHTEGPGHVDKTVHSVYRALKNYHMTAALVTVMPTQRGEDQVVELQSLRTALEAMLPTGDPLPAAIILRTGKDDRQHKNWSNTNPPYLEDVAAAWLAKMGVDHLLLDLPSVDREVDDGALLAHKAFWQLPGSPRMHATITELIQVPQEAKDALYWLNLQVSPFVNDAAPSRPLIFPIEPM